MSVQMDKMLYLHNFTDEEHLLVCVCVSHQHVPASLRMALKKIKTWHPQGYSSPLPAFSVAI